ncbi:MULTISPECIES: hypothetical protein [Flavobacterium]|uniref:hypothetical protein n=1 Tax=Flavobacterium TaxID=237 RepID=UPI001FCC7CE1|nr:MULTISPECIES: hypothetical protein [Flavobacterium]UOK42219.1 hypothetical protein LZF87_12980 [Flavobacterium enshiense]
MKKALYILFVLIVSCSNLKSTQTGDLQLEILESAVNDNTNIDAQILNKTKKDYYLLLDTASFHHKLNFYEEKSLLYSMGINMYDENNNYIPQALKDNCENVTTNEKKKFTTRDILKIRQGQTIKIKIPFKIRYIVNEYCQIGYQTELMKKGTKYYLQLISYEPNEYVKTLLSNEVKDSLKNLNYELYDRTILSNKVRLNFDIK